MGDIPRRPSSGSKIRLKKGGQARLNFFTIWLAWPPGAEQQELPYSVGVTGSTSALRSIVGGTKNAEGPPHTLCVLSVLGVPRQLKMYNLDCWG